MPAGAVGGSGGGWTVGVAYGRMETVLSIGSERAELEQRSLVASFSARLGRIGHLGGVAGASLGGTLALGGDVYELLAGWLVGLQGGASWAEDGWIPSRRLTGTLAIGGAPTRRRGGGEDAHYLAMDARLEAAVGWSFLDVVDASLAVRVFGGPILWRRHGGDVTGTDRFHYQVGFGVGGRLPGGVRLGLDWSPLGERAVSASISVDFGGASAPAPPLPAPPPSFDSVARRGR